MLASIISRAIQISNSVEVDYSLRAHYSPISKHERKQFRGTRENYSKPNSSEPVGLLFYYYYFAVIKCDRSLTVRTIHFMGHYFFYCMRYFTFTIIQRVRYGVVMFKIATDILSTL
jgi:hypothetical protein